jgi:hypothetical protein
MVNDEAQPRAFNTYRAAADTFEETAQRFWDLFGSRTVNRLQLPRRARFLDVCAGAGASAIPGKPSDTRPRLTGSAGGTTTAVGR